MPGQNDNLYKCPDCGLYIMEIAAVKAGTTVDLYYLFCPNCETEHEMRYFQLQRIP